LIHSEPLRDTTNFNFLSADMEKYVVGSKILKKEQVLISVFLIAILVMSSGSLVVFASGSHTIVVKPSGDKTGAKDTKAIQAALNMCTRGDPRCTVQLLSGTYYINSQINVYGFQGSFVGAGEGQTTIEVPLTVTLPPEAAVYDTSYATAPYWATPPSTSNPWPNIFTFVGGSFSISGMTIEDLNPTPVTSWWFLGTSLTSLSNAIQITGEPSYASQIPQVSAAINQVQVVGYVPTTTPPSTAYSIGSAIEYGGQLLPAVWTEPFGDIIPISGTFSVTHSVFDVCQQCLFVGWTDRATVTLGYNTLVNSLIPFIPYDVSNSIVTITGNQATDIPYDAGVFVVQSYTKPPCTASVTSDCLLPSTVYVTDNYFQTNWGGSGVYFEDFGTSSTMSGVVTGNTVVTDTSCLSVEPGCYTTGYPAIGADYVDVGPASSSFVVSQNTILGGGSGVLLSTGPNSVVSDNHITGAMAGVTLGCSGCTSPFPTGAIGVHVTGNIIKNSGQYGIAVIADSSYNKIIGNIITGTASTGYDLYWDQTGTGNVWFGNFCGDHTSSPPGLC
jgi:parallel beta-helix repeat protein